MKRYFTFLLAASLAVTGCGKIGPGEPENPTQPAKTAFEVLIEKLKIAIPDLNNYPIIGLGQISTEGNYIVGGISNEKYLFSLVSKDNKLVLKHSDNLESNVKGKYNSVIVSPVKGYENIYNFLLSDGTTSTYSGYRLIINVDNNMAFPIRNSDVDMSRIINLQKSNSIISFVASEKLLLYSFKGDFITSFSSFSGIDQSSKYVIINEAQVVSGSIGSDWKIYLKNNNIHSPFGKVITNWNKSYSIFDWTPKSGETRELEFEISDDRDNVVVSYIAKGKKYDINGDLQNFQMNATFKIDKKNGELVQ